MLRLTNYALDALLSFSRAPLRLSVFAGLVFLLFGLGLAVHAVFGRLFLGRHPDPRWTVLLVSLQVIGGLVLCGLGTLGEYVARIYEQVKSRPLYLVKETEARTSRPAVRKEGEATDAPSVAA